MRSRTFPPRRTTIPTAAATRTNWKGRWTRGYRPPDPDRPELYSESEWVLRTSGTATAAMDRIDFSKMWGMDSVLNPGESREWHLAIIVAQGKEPRGLNAEGDFLV